MITRLVQSIINGFAAFRRFIGMLPQSPFRALEEIIPENPFIDAVLWIVPVQPALALVQLWLTAILIYYAIKVPLRWLKVVKG